MIALAEPKLLTNVRLVSLVILGSPAQPVQLLEITETLVRLFIARRAQPTIFHGQVVVGCV